jgi:hypothetical protein
MLDNDIRHSQLASAYKSGTNWFYWIAGLTLATSLIGLLGGSWGFFLSLGTTQLIDALANVMAGELGNATKVIAAVLDIFACAIFAGFGWLAYKRHLWAYVAGMVFFALDGGVMIFIGYWIGVAFHGLVLFWMFRGYQAGRDLVSLEKLMAERVPEPAVQHAPVPQPSI